jgi:DNA transposition AAA+ family ATPase
MSEEAVQAELREAAGRIRAYGEAQGLSDRELVRRFPGLGSERVWTRIAAGDLDGVNAAQWVQEYQGVLASIEVLREHADGDDPLYDDLTTVLDLRAAVAEAMKERGLNRLVIFQGPQGCGKTTAALLLRAKYGSRVVFAEATELWRENCNVMLGGLLEAFGVQHAPTPAYEKWHLLVGPGGHLVRRRVCLIVDEAHHLGPRSLNMVKSLINCTPGEVVILAMGTLWRRLETAAYEEARQLTQNRLLERIRSDGIEPADAEKFCARALGLAAGEAKAAAAALCQAAGMNGNLAFLKLVCRRARRLAGKGAVTVEVVKRAAGQVVASR